MEARIYKPKRQRNGKRVISRLYRARVKLDGEDRVRDIALKVSDRQVAQQKLNEIVRELEHEAAGLMPAKLARDAAQCPLLDLVTEYVNELTVLGRSEDHLRHVDKRLRKLVREGHWKKLADVTPASFQSWRKRQTDKAPKTLNEFLAALSAFWTWLRRQNRVAINPFELVERVDTRGQERCIRRALSDLDVVRLLQVAGTNQMAYLLPLYAGLRWNEANRLRWGDLVLGEQGGLLRMPVAINKNRKDQPLPLHRDLVAALQRHKPKHCRPEDTVLVNGVPHMNEFRADLIKAGIAFMDQSGHRLDYHALRTTFITRLSRLKVHPRLAMEFARHSDLKLTMKNYTDAGQLPLQEVMDTLPGYLHASRIDSRNLVTESPAVSPCDAVIETLNTKKPPENIGESHDLSLSVPACPQSEEWRREGDSNPR